MQLALRTEMSLSSWPGHRFIPLWHRNDGEFFADFGGALQPAMAMSVAESQGSQVILKAIEHRLEVLLEPEADINVLPLDARPNRFSTTRVARPAPYDPDVRRSARFFKQYAVDTIEEERMLGASCFVPPHHLVGGAKSQGRLNDRRLIELAHAHYDTHIGGHPSLVAGVQRRFAAAGTFHLGTLADPVERAALIAMYAEMPGDLLWIRIANLNDQASVPDIEAAADFLLRLREAAGRDVVIAGAGTLSYPFLAGGLSVAFGFGAGEYYRGPRVKKAERQNFRVTTFHQAGMRSVIPGEAGDLAHALFDAAPCDCTHHPSHVPPSNGGPRRRHTASCRIQDAALFTRDDFVNAEDELLLRVATAEKLSEAHAPTRPFRAEAYRTVIATARRLRAEALEETG